MRYAIFTDIHANLEALDAVLAKIDELAQEDPIDQIWFLGDLVGYGPNPNECIVKLRERTDVIIAGNHDWAAVGKIDLEDFSEAARVSAEWTAVQLTEEHRQFLINLPERLQIGECTLVHGSPYGPLWEYLTSEVLAERSFQYFPTRYCLVGHTHVPVIFQQPDTISSVPTTPLENSTENDVETSPIVSDSETPANHHSDEHDDEDETVEMVAVRPPLQTNQAAIQLQQAAIESSVVPSPKEASTEIEARHPDNNDHADNSQDTPSIQSDTKQENMAHDQETDSSDEQDATNLSSEPSTPVEPDEGYEHSKEEIKEATPEEVILNAEDRLNQEIEELLSLLGLSQSMVQVTNEMIIPPEGDWQAPEGYRAIINPGGVGQPRDGDSRAAFMIYNTERGFTFYRVPYAIDKTQEKIIKAGLPPYLATRLAYGR
jgi:diadenosine tetraphosphatase ApaH/serine/threonine PP2A family protein phosphatase